MVHMVLQTVLGGFKGESKLHLVWLIVLGVSAEPEGHIRTLYLLSRLLYKSGPSGVSHRICAGHRAGILSAPQALRSPKFHQHLTSED